MAFDVMDIDLSQLFKNDDTYTIPRYQRNYVWNRTGSIPFGTASPGNG